ncbi:hypothetical protein [Niallia sp. 01092]|uniref:hypothetical protein n=1 Tax=unclassified Niallia TaxID=2837522 RepID=UPI003FD32CF4
MKKVHETQYSEEFNNTNENKVFIPSDIEQFNYLEGGVKPKSINVKSLPRGIKYIGYFIFGSVILTFILLALLNFIM